MRPSRSALAPWLVLAGAVLWGTTGTSQAFAPEGASSAAIGAVRLLVGGGALLVLAAVRGSLRGWQRWPRRGLLVCAASMALYQPFFFAGVASAGVALGTVVAIGSAPVFAGLLGLWIKKEYPGKRWLAATMLAVSGCLLLFLPGARGVSVNAGGVLLALLAGLAYAVYAVASKDLLSRHSPDTVLGIVFSLSALLLLPVLFTQDLSWTLTPRGLLISLHLGLFATALSYSLFSRGLVLIPVSSAVTLTLAEPLTAALLGFLVLGEQLTPAAAAGIFLIAGGLLMLSAPAKAAGSRTTATTGSPGP